MRDFYLNYEAWFAYGFGLFFGFVGGSKNNNYVGALAFAGGVIIVLLLIRWILVGKLFTRNRVE